MEDPKLSDRERTVLLLAAEGLTDKEIAGQLGLSLKTIHTYWDRMRQKFHASTRTQVFARFLRISVREDDKYGLGRIFNHWDDGVWVIQRDGRTIYANARVSEQLKVAPLALKQRSAFELLEAAGASEARQLAHFDGQNRRQISVTVPESDGADKHEIHIVSTPFANEGALVKEVVLLIRESPVQMR